MCFVSFLAESSYSAGTHIAAAVVFNSYVLTLCAGHKVIYLPMCYFLFSPYQAIKPDFLTLLYFGGEFAYLAVSVCCGDSAEVGIL